jgi:hypothetical protein
MLDFLLQPDKINHILLSCVISTGLLSLLAISSLKQWHPLKHYLIILTIFIPIGLFKETYDYLYKIRHFFDVQDIVANYVGVLIVISLHTIACHIYQRLRRRPAGKEGVSGD